MKIILFVLIISILLIVLINYIKYRVDMNLLKIYKNNVFITNQGPILNEYPVSDEIPKIIHQSDKDIENFKKFDLENDINKKNCPGYDFRFYDNEDIVFYIKNNFNSRVLDAYLSINDVFGPCKSDFFRYLVLYKEGGVYLDNKSIIIKNLDKFLKDSSGKLLITSHNFSLLNKINIFSPHNTYYYFNKKYNVEHGEFVQWFIASNPGNKLLKILIEKIIFNIEKEKKRKKKEIYDRNGVLVLTGPVMFTETILENNYKDCFVAKDMINNFVKYRVRDHKKLTNKHYSKIQNKSVII